MADMSKGGTGTDLRRAIGKTFSSVRSDQRNPLRLYKGKALSEDDPDNITLEELRNNPDLAKQLFEEAERLAEIKQTKKMGGYIKKYANGGGVRKVR
tara:strand:+ start:3223 stop:3513 length:291 start_codon:yes stop_codon:yes gene_type:complete